MDSSSNVNLLTSKNIDESSEILVLGFASQWSDEDIVTLATSLFDATKNASLTEKVQGADREYFRFIWQDHAFILHFEVYGQSCWIEPEGLLDDNAMKMLYDEIILK